MGEMSVVILIFICGLLAMFIELFIPGVVMGVVGMMAAIGSIVYAVMTGHMTAAAVLLVIALTFVPIFFIMWKGVMARFMAIKAEERDFRPSTTVTEDLVGIEGEATTALRPSGIARLSDRRLDVVTRGEMLSKGTRIKVIEVSGNRVVVKEV